MFTPPELSDIKRRLEDGETQASIASSFKISVPAFRDKLSRSGYRYRGTIAPVQPVAMGSENYALTK